MIFYFVLGFFISEHYGTIRQKISGISIKSLSLAVVLSTIYYAVVFYQTILLSNTPPMYFWLYQLTGPFYCLVLVVFYLRIAMWWGEPNGFFTTCMEKIGENSFGIYLTQGIFMTAFTFVLPAVGLTWNNLLFYPT
jgi:peptidoglycan/LPS O-acetylase OafA/YrhL